MRRLTGVREGPLPAADIRIGTTIATNALLERKGEPVLLAFRGPSPFPAGPAHPARREPRPPRHPPH